MIGNSPAVAALPPLHEICLAGPGPGIGSLEKVVNVPPSFLGSPVLLGRSTREVTSRLIAQMKPASSRATAVTATVFACPS